MLAHPSWKIFTVPIPQFISPLGMKGKNMVQFYQIGANAIPTIMNDDVVYIGFLALLKRKGVVNVLTDRSMKVMYAE